MHKSQNPKPTPESEVPTQPVNLDNTALVTSARIEEIVKTRCDVEVSVVTDEAVVIAKPDDVPALCYILKDDVVLDLNYLRCISVVDYEDRLEVVYHLFSLKNRHKVVVKAAVPLENPRIPSLTCLWKGADWFEREGHDLFGVIFEGHPNLTPLLLYEGFEGYPGRKSFPFHEYDEW